MTKARDKVRISDQKDVIYKKNTINIMEFNLKFRIYNQKTNYNPNTKTNVCSSLYHKKILNKSKHSQKKIEMRECRKILKIL